MAYTYKPYEEDDEVRAARERMRQAETYRESDSVRQARDQLGSLQRPADYSSAYTDRIGETLGQIEARKPFTYDVNTDALYQQYREQYLRNGRAAMQDTMGKAAALTGGYGNSYAAAAGNQAYQQYVGALNDRIPELYRAALERYNAEGQELKDRYAMYADREAADYGRYRDAVSDYRADQAYLTDRYNAERQQDYAMYGDQRDYLQGAYNADRAFGYGVYGDEWNRGFNAYQQGVQENQWAQTFGENVRQYDQDFAERVRQYNASLAENQRQFNANLGENQRQFDANMQENQRQYDTNIGVKQQQHDADLAYKYANAGVDLPVSGSGNAAGNGNGAVNGSGNGEAEQQSSIWDAAEQTDNVRNFTANVATEARFNKSPKLKEQYKTYKEYLQNTVAKWLHNGDLEEAEAQLILTQIEKGTFGR